MKKALLIAIPVLVLLGLVGWRLAAKKGQEAELKQGSQARRSGGANVVLATAGPKRIENSLQTVGSVEAPYNVKLAPQVSGRIQFLQAREGDSVKPGQVLVRIDPTEVQGQVLQQQAAVAEARSRLAQAQITQGSTNVGITAQIRQQQAGLSSAEADLQQVTQNFSSQVAAAEASVTDAQGRVGSASATVESARANVESAKANQANAQTRYDRTLSLYKQGFVAAQDVDDVRTALQVQQSAVQVAEKQLASTQAALKSAQAVERSAENQLAITKRKGKSDIADAQAKVRQARASVQVAVANQSQSPAYQANIAALQSAVSSAEAQLRQAQARLAYTVLKSPIDGTVTSRDMDQGATATTGASILTIAFLKWVYITTSIPVEQSGVVVPGVAVNITFDSLPGKTLNGVISEVNKSADAQNRQFTARIRLDNTGGQLRPGMFAKITSTLNRVDAAVTVPREAVKQQPDGAHVMVVDSANAVHDTKVDLGASDTTTYEVRNGLKVGDKVVVLSYSPVKDGQKVNIQQPGSGGSGGTGGGRGRRRGGGGQGAGQ